MTLTSEAASEGEAPVRSGAVVRGKVIVRGETMADGEDQFYCHLDQGRDLKPDLQVDLIKEVPLTVSRCRSPACRCRNYLGDRFFLIFLDANPQWQANQTIGKFLGYW